MDKVLFSITCTTCQARLNVRDPAAIGEILTCPRCESFIQVMPPPGWDPLAAAAPESATPAPPEPAAGASAGRPKPPPLPGAADLARLSDSGVEVELDLPAPAAPGRAAIVGRWLALAVLPLGALIAAVSLWQWMASSEPVDPVSEMKAALKAEHAAVTPVVAPIPKPEFARAAEQKKWLPRDARLVVSLPLSQLAALPDWTHLLEQLDPFCRTTLRPLLEGLGLRAQGVRRLTWASTDLSSPAESSVVLLELDGEIDAQSLARSGQPTQLLLNSTACRRREGSWRHPFVFVAERTVLTGREDLLRKLAARGEPALESQALEQLLQEGLPPGAYALRIDLAAARASGFPLPWTMLDIWPSGRQAWRTLWQSADGLGLSLEPGAEPALTLQVTCEGVSSAAKVKAALEELVAAARQALPGQIASIIAKLQAGQLTAPQGAEYDAFLKAALRALQSAKVETSDSKVTLRLNWPDGFGTLVRSALRSRPAIESDWRTGAVAADQANHERLGAALRGHQKAEGRWPAAAAGGALLPPETRLSWIAAMLPYFGHSDWHRQLEFGYAWNAAQNKPVTSRVLDEAVNPSQGPSRTEAGFPVTHYVGVGGVGADGPTLKADNPRAGVFGFGRTTRPEEITDGASNTIAVLGVTGKPGPWAAGGPSTVRPLTTAPYVNGPDGFGSGQPNGMLAGMADGSVRFLSKDIDPRVLEQMATIAGGERPPAPAEKPAPPQEVAVAHPTPPVLTPAKPSEKLLPPAGKPEPAPAVEEQAVEEAADVEIDVQRRLAGVVPQIEIAATPLADVVRLLEEMSGLLVTLDVDAIQRLGVSPSDRVDLRASEKTFGELLESLAAQRKMIVAQAGNCVVLTCPEADRGSLKSIPYTISDLARDGAAAAVLADQIRRLVAPESWQTAGGRGTIKPADDSLVVVQSDDVHGQVIDFCERLRAARGLPLRSRFSTEKFSLATRWQRAAPLLGRPVSLNFHLPTPLRDILARLAQEGQTPILVDWAALGVPALAAQPKATLSVENQPLSAALDAMLRPLKLGCRATRSGLVEITTQKAVDERLELELYPVRELVEAGQMLPALAEKIKSQVAKSTWADAGGAAEVLFDEPSATLLVLQSQPVQRAIAGLLAEQSPPGKPAK